MPVCDNFMTFSNLLFDANDDFSFSDDESSSDEDVLNEIYSNLLFDEEIIFVKIDASIISMIDFSLEQFSSELTHNDLIPPGINEADFDLEEDIHFIERLLEIQPCDVVEIHPREVCPNILPLKPSPLHMILTLFPSINELESDHNDFLSSGDKTRFKDPGYH
ncbi:hypothetical protein Tco_0760954 [Tanacetum coccineum]